MRFGVAAMVVVLSGTLGAQQPPQPAGGGRSLQARDGDLVLIEGDASVRIVRSRDANISAVYNQAERWVVIMVDYARGGKPPDGGVDWSYYFTEVSSWPLGERWSGAAHVDEYSHTASGFGPGSGSLGITTDQGLTQILNPREEEVFRDSAALALVRYRGHGTRTGGNRPFAEVEPAQVAQVRETALRGAGAPGSPPRGNFSGVVGGVVGGTLSTTSQVEGTQPVRVGGNIKQPAKLVHVDPVLPPVAAQANVRGMVIVEIVIGTDGTVTDAKILRSIPLLDEAALAAVRQWKYTATLLNGMPVPVIMTATVNFQ